MKVSQLKEILSSWGSPDLNVSFVLSDQPLIAHDVKNVMLKTVFVKGEEQLQIMLTDAPPKTGRSTLPKIVSPT